MTSRNASDHAPRCSTCGGWQTAEFPNGDIAHCPTCQRGCICMTAADLGFSGRGDGVNPNLIAATHPECPEHGFRADYMSDKDRERLLAAVERGATDVADTPDSAPDDATAVVAKPSRTSLADGLADPTTTPIGAD